MKYVEAFFAYARERYGIMLRRNEGLVWPWTDDPVLKAYRFCNVFREDDTVTKWIRTHITPEVYNTRMYGATVIARWFNRVETLERLDRAELLFNWDLDVMEITLQGQHPLITGAYIIKTPNGMTKLPGILWCLEQILPHTQRMQSEVIPGHTALRSVHTTLKNFPYLGSFMAYELVTDFRHSFLSEAPDIMTWAVPGPGATRGYGRVVVGNSSHYSYPNKTDERAVMNGMRDLLAASQDPDLWPSNWPVWEMREVEHTLCEFDKYERARLGQGAPKQRYWRSDGSL